MKKILSLIILCLAIPITSFAQLSIGTTAGYTHNTLDTDTGYYYSREYISEGGFAVAVPIQYSFNDWFSIGTEVGYTSKNYSWERIVTYFSNDDKEYERYKNGYLQIPITAKFSFGGERVRGFLNVGGYLGAWLNSSVTGFLVDPSSHTFVSTQQSYDFLAERDNRFDYGALAGVGIEYRATPQISLTIEGRLLYGLSDTQKQYQMDQFHKYNTTMVAQMGLLYHFSL
ncbi:MAG: porin family protein [Rikenellaceae bacterium]